MDTELLSKNRELNCTWKQSKLRMQQSIEVLTCEMSVMKMWKQKLAEFLSAFFLMDI